MTTLIEFLRNEEEKHFTTEEKGRVVTYVKSPCKREGKIPYEMVFRIQEMKGMTPFDEKGEVFALIIRNQIITMEDVDFCDVGAGGIQIRGYHKSFTRYTYGNQVTISYDYSNADEAIQRFINMWDQQDNSKHNNAYSRFLEMGNEYGWD